MMLGSALMTRQFQTHIYSTNESEGDWSKGGKRRQKKDVSEWNIFLFLTTKKKIVYSSAEKNPSIDEKKQTGEMQRRGLQRDEDKSLW